MPIDDRLNPPLKVGRFKTMIGPVLTGCFILFMNSGLLLASPRASDPNSVSQPASRGQKSSSAHPSGPADSKDPKKIVESTADQKSTIWSLGAPPDHVRLSDGEIPFTITTGKIDVDNLQLNLIRSTLQDPNTFFRIDANQLQICSDGKCGGSLSIAKNSTSRLALEISPNFKEAGVFTGEVGLNIAGQPEIHSFKLTVYSSGPRAQILGAIAIAFGLGLYFFINVWLRRNISVEEALIPAYQLQDTVSDLEVKLDSVQRVTHIAFVGFTSAFSTLNAQLSRQALTNVLPPTIMSPWTSSTDWQTGFKNYIKPISDKISGLVVLVDSGIQTAATYWATYQSASAAALNQIDGLAVGVVNGTVAQNELVPILQPLQAAVNRANSAILAGVLNAIPQNTGARLLTLPADTETLQVRLFQNTLLVWWLMALVAVASGVYTLIIGNFGFGTVSDYIKCFFWGLGFSVAGTHLGQMTMGSVAGSFGVSIPKS